MSWSQLPLAWLIWAGLLIGATGPAKADAPTQQRETQRLARDIVAQAVPQANEAAPPDETPPAAPADSVMSKIDLRAYESLVGPSFSPPQIAVDKSFLYYDLGSLEIDRVYFDFNRPLDAPGEGQEIDDDPSDLPLKAQLLVELIRRFCKDLGQGPPWQQPLARVEQVVLAEIQSIELTMAAVGKSMVAQGDKSYRKGLERQLFAQLAEYDARVHRTIMSHLDNLADANGLVLRRLPPQPSSGGFLEPFAVSYVVQPEPTSVFTLSRTEYYRMNMEMCAAFPGVTPEQYVNDWQPADPLSFPRGDVYVIAVWGTPDVTQTYATSVKYPLRIAKNGQEIRFGQPRTLQKPPLFDPAAFKDAPGGGAPAAAPAAPRSPPGS